VPTDPAAAATTLGPLTPRGVTLFADEPMPEV